MTRKEGGCKGSWLLVELRQRMLSDDVANSQCRRRILSADCITCFMSVVWVAFQQASLISSVGCIACFVGRGRHFSRHHNGLSVGPHFGVGFGELGRLGGRFGGLRRALSPSGVCLVHLIHTLVVCLAVDRRLVQGLLDVLDA